MCMWNLWAVPVILLEYLLHDIVVLLRRDCEPLEGSDYILFSHTVPTKPKPYFYCHSKLIFLGIYKLGGGIIPSSEVLNLKGST